MIGLHASFTSPDDTVFTFWFLQLISSQFYLKTTLQDKSLIFAAFVGRVYLLGLSDPVATETEAIADSFLPERLSYANLV